MSVILTRSALALRALRTIGVYSNSQALDPNDGQTVAEIIEEMIDAWNVQRLTFLKVDRFVFDLVSDKGGPDNPYTIGPGGDFDTGTAARPPQIRWANLLLNTASDFPTEVPLAILTDQQYAANPIKSLTNSQPQSLYYNADVPLGTIQLWNIPNTDENQLVLYLDRLTPQFTGAQTAYVCPPSYAKVFRLELAMTIAPIFGVPDADLGEVKEQYKAAKLALFAQNAQQIDLAMDPAFVGDNRPSYVIQTDEGG